MSDPVFTDNRKIAADLRSLISGDVYASDVSRQLFSTAACIYEKTPLVIVSPKNTEDVRKAAKYSSETGVPITARGAGSSLAGAALGTGIILDFKKYMNSIISVDGDVVKVQPGLIYGKLNEALRGRNLHFAPDPSSGAYCSIGGMIGTNAAGAHSLYHGTTKDWVESLSVVTADGGLIKAEKRILGDLDGGTDVSYYTGLYDILKLNEDLIERSEPDVNKNSSGYNVFEPLRGAKLDMTRIMVGSEGTLGIVTEAELKIAPLPASNGLALLSFDSLESAGESIVELMELNPAALDMIDDRLLRLSVEANPDLKRLIPAGTKYVLFAEFFGENAGEVKEKLSLTEKRLSGGSKAPLRIDSSVDAEEMSRLWAVRLAAVGILHKIEGNAKPTAFAEDGTVHYSKLADYVSGVFDIYNSLGVDGSAFGHAGNGNLHIRPMLDLRDERDVGIMGEIAERSHALVRELNGTLTGEHADGIARTPYIKEFYGELYPVFEAVKNLFDPKRTLNPDVIVTDEPAEVSANLRYGTEYSRHHTRTYLDETVWFDTAELCHGCAACSEYCPVSIVTRSESSTARAKANLLRGVVSGKMPAESLLEIDFKSVIDECVNCKLCLTECPTEVDIPGLAQEARAYYVERMGSSMRDALLGSSKEVSEVSAFFAPLTNVFLGIKLFRRLSERFLKLHPNRRYQKFRRGSLTGKTFVHKSKGDRGEVVYFAGCHANYSDPKGEMRSTVQLLEKLGMKVILPEWRCCGVANLSLGRKSQAAHDASLNVEMLLPYVDRGVKVVASSASCGLAIRMEYPGLLKTSAAERVSESVVDLHEYLGSLDEEDAFDGEWKPIKKRVVYHEPCHLKAQKTGFDVTQMLRRIPKLEVVNIADSCCGIAGTFGYKSEGFDLSMRMGEPLMSEISAASPDLVLSGCGTCQVQILQGTGIKSIHPVTLLNRSYQTR